MTWIARYSAAIRRGYMAASGERTWRQYWQDRPVNSPCCAIHQNRPISWMPAGWVRDGWARLKAVMAR
ncbi:hypothetical protein [Gluconacetobacter liquefaciens]|nr:hypothetical protein [Gluconacetobacter liquefaciens]